MQGRYQHKGQHKRKKRTKTSMPPLGFKTTISVFVLAKTVYASGRAAAVIDSTYSVPVLTPFNIK
jgi:hypothetical protein